MSGGLLSPFFLELPDISNTRFAVEIVFLSRLQAYILIVPVYRPPSWIFPPVTSGSIPISSVGQSVVENGDSRWNFASISSESWGKLDPPWLFV